MRKEYWYLMIGFILIWILGFFLFLPTPTKKTPQPGISDEATSTSINK